MNKISPIVANNGFSCAPNIEISANRSARCWMSGQSVVRMAPRINGDQLTSLSAMIAYVAARSGQSEFGIERSLSDRFSVPNAKFLPANQFENAIRYLVDSMPS